MNQWLTEFAQSHGVVFTLLVLSVASATGLLLGGIQIRGIGLGVAGVLFSSLVIGHLQLMLDHKAISFVREFGLLLFVYCIGIKVGPGFFRSLGPRSLVLNLLAISIVGLGAILAVVLVLVLKIDVAAAVGIFSGATTNTPSLGAAQDTLKSFSGSSQAIASATLGYAVAYPFGIVGIILVMLLIKVLRGVNLGSELAEIEREEHANSPHLERRNITVGSTLSQRHSLQELEANYGVTISRIMSPTDTYPRLAEIGVPIRVGDTILAVGRPARLVELEKALGQKAEIDLMDIPSRVKFRNIVVTREDVVGKSLAELGIDQHHHVNVTRVRRHESELAPLAALRLQFGDTLRVVGKEKALLNVERIVGNSNEALNHLDLVPVFFGLIVGILLGSIPIPLPGIPSPIKIGVAGGALLSALILGHMGTIGRLSWYMPPAANISLRDLGITLFLSAVGLEAGGRFFETLFSGDGLLWLACGAVITTLPLFLVGLAASSFLKMNFLRICGLLAGSMTDPPALAFATTFTRSDTPVVTYASVYPVTMIARIIVVQVIIIKLASLG